MGRKEQPQAEVNPLRQQVQDVVDQWYRDNMHNTVVSRDTDVHNVVHNAKGLLVEALVAALATSVPNQE